MAQKPTTAAKPNDGDIARSLTPRELRYALGVFGSAIDYKRTKVHNTPAYFFQPNGTAIAPNGEVYFNKSDYLADFGVNVSQMAWLIHELTHVWQHQQGMWVRARALANRTYEYGDLSGSKRALTTFGVEQQASIVADYFRIYHGMKPTRGSGAIADYIATIPFIQGSRT